MLGMTSQHLVWIIDPIKKRGISWQFGNNSCQACEEKNEDMSLNYESIQP